jgi:hypothetical protein
MKTYTEEQLYMTDILTSCSTHAIDVNAFDMIKILNSANEELLRITPSGEVIAPSLEAASKAGRVFVDSIRHYIDELKINT